MNKLFKLNSKIISNTNFNPKYYFLNINIGNLGTLPQKTTLYKFPLKTFAVPLSFKNKVNMFYKHVHPDILGATCPSEYRTINEKSVQDLNSYMESLDKGLKFENKTIKFYIKLEEKDKKDEEKIKINFSQLEVKLEDIKQQSSASNREISLHNLIEENIKKISKLKKDALKGNSGSAQFKNNLFENYNNAAAEKVEKENLGRVKILKSDKLMEDFEKIEKQNYLRYAVRKIEMKNRKDKLTEKLDRAMHNKTDFFTNRRTADPIARQLVDNMKSFKNLQYLNVTIYPTHLIYMVESLDDNQIDEFIKRIKMENFSSTEKFSKKIEFRAIAVELCDPTSLIRIMVHNNCYSINLPGYLTMPYNFEFDEMKKFYEENKNEIFRTRSRYLDEKKTIEKVVEELKMKFSLKEILFEEKTENLIKNYNETRNYLEEAQDIHINLKKLKKILNENFVGDNYKFDNINMKIKYKKEEKNKNEKLSEEIENLVQKPYTNSKQNEIEIEFPIKNDENILRNFNEILSKNKNSSQGISAKN